MSNQQPSGAAASAAPISALATTPAVAIGGVFADMLFAGLVPGTVGEYQVNVRVPAGATVGTAVPVTVRAGGVLSNTVTIAVQ